MQQFIQKILYYTFLAIRRFVYLTLYLFGTVLPRNKIVVLCYHAIGDDDWRFGIDLATLKRQMLCMLRYYTPVTIQDIVAYTKGQKTFTKPVFAVTFDDGYADILSSVEMFQFYGIQPAAFVISDETNIDSQQLGAVRPFLSTEQIKHFHDLGWTIGSHSATHADFYELNAENAIKQVVGSKKSLEKRLGCMIDCFAYPKGRYTDDVLRAFDQAGYIGGFSMDDRMVRSGSDSRIIPRVGIDRTHTYLEFEATISMPAIFGREIIKRIDKWNTMRARTAKGKNAKQ